MSKKEQAALIAFLNSFRLNKRVTSFDQLADGKALLEVMSNVDTTHFKNASTRGPSGSPSDNNWVLKMNSLKRLYRLLLSYPLPSPYAPLSQSSLPEPPFSTIARTPTSAESTLGLIQLSRMCLSISVWAPGNEKVIAKIQGLGEGHMAELMRGIEEVTATIPERGEGEGESSADASPQKTRENSPPPSGLRAERDKLIHENDELSSRCEQMTAQMASLTADLEEMRSEKEETAGRLKAQSEAANGLRSSQTAHNEADALRSDLGKAEENLAQTEADLQKQSAMVSDLMKLVDELKAETAETTRLRDQLDEFRHAAEKLQKSENVIEKYKKKLEDSAGLRRELKTLEQENSTLINTNAQLEADLKKAGSSKGTAEGYRSQIDALERQARDQADQIADLTVQLENAQLDLSATEEAHERDLEELHRHQEKVRELEMGDDGGATEEVGDVSLGEELIDLEGVHGQPETRASLKIRVRALQKELARFRATASPDRTSPQEGKASGTDGEAQSKELRDRLGAATKRSHQLGVEVAELKRQLAKAKSSPIRPVGQDQHQPPHAEVNDDSPNGQIARLQNELEETKQRALSAEKRYKLEQQLMLSAWHELGARTVRDHISAAGVRRPMHRPVATSWLGRQRRHQEEATFAR